MMLSSLAAVSTLSSVRFLKPCSTMVLTFVLEPSCYVPHVAWAAVFGVIRIICSMAGFA